MVSFGSMPKTVDLPTLENEFQFGYPLRAMVGLDEVGRGCIAGPVVAAAAVLPPGLDLNRAGWNPDWLQKIQDSKKLSAEDRDFLYEYLKNWLADFAIGSVSVEEIDRINIHHASLLAMDRAVQGLKKGLHSKGFYLIDGKWAPVGVKKQAHQAVIKGDLKCLSIACASVLAKVHRDRLMGELDRDYPGYGLAKHKGYPTPEHLRALDSHGVQIIHRKSYGPVASRLATV